jgi:hypothetical protein
MPAGATPEINSAVRVVPPMPVMTRIGLAIWWRPSGSVACRKNGVREAQYNGARRSVKGSIGWEVVRLRRRQTAAYLLWRRKR